MLSTCVCNGKYPTRRKGSQASKAILEELTDTSLSFLSFSFESLGFVTPWGPRGYDVALATTFTYIAPVWYQVHGHKRGSTLQPDLGGAHDVDREWVQRVRARGSKVVPRFIFEGFSSSDWATIQRSETIRKRISEFITEQVSTEKYDGVVLEMTDAWPSAKKASASPLELIREIHQSVKALGQEKSVIIVASPHLQLNSLEDLAQIASVADRIVVMTYDYSIHQVGPNAPIQWVRDVITLFTARELAHLKGKLLLGLNFYGRLFHGSPGSYPNHQQAILGHEFVDLIQRFGKDGVLKYDEKDQEYYFQFKGENGIASTAYYPSMRSIAARLSLAQEFDLPGVAIWELAQGLDEFTGMFRQTDT